MQRFHECYAAPASGWYLVPIATVVKVVSRQARIRLFAVAILLCYGGGFDTMPAFAVDSFGSRDIASI